MAANPNNIWILNESDPRFTFSSVLVTSGAVGTIATGTPTKGADAAAASPWTGAVVPMVDSDGTTSNRFTGLAKNTSTDTASAAGVVSVWLPLPGIVYASKSTTAANSNTAAKVQALFGKRVKFDLISSVWSVDDGDADAVANCVTIVGGDPFTSTLWFVYRASGSMLNFGISA